MKQFINNLSIRKKFILLYLLGVLLPIIVLLCYVLTNVTDEIRLREAQNATQSLERVYSTVERQFSEIVMLSNAISTDKQLNEMLNHNYSKPSVYFAQYYDAIKPTFSRYQNAYITRLSDIELYTDNPTLFNGGHCIRLDEKARSEEWYPEVPANGSTRLVAYIHQLYSGDWQLQLSILRDMTEKGSYHQILKIDLNMESVNRLLAQEGAFLSVYLTAPDGLAVSYPGCTKDSLLTTRKDMTDVSVDMTASFGDRTAMAGWKLEASMNKDVIETHVRKAIWVGLAIGLICSLFAGFLSLVFARSIDLRSQRLLRHMDSMTAEHFEPITRALGKDEIGELTDHFNTMGNRLKQLIQDIYVLQLQQKTLELENVRAELKYLQAQIDPHFLFNTLNAILVVCVRNGYTELSEVIRALSKLLRRMVDTTCDTVTLREELEFVRMVLTIERFRFGDKLRYELEVAPDTMERRVPVMCVQGLVENACKYGVQSIDDQGVIRIHAWIETGALHIEVIDNGVGIEPTRLTELQAQITDPKDMPGNIGLQNIYRRLKLYYGAEAMLTLRNCEDRGMVAAICVPQEVK